MSVFTKVDIESMYFTIEKAGSTFEEINFNLN